MQRYTYGDLHVLQFCIQPLYRGFHLIDRRCIDNLAIELIQSRLVILDLLHEYNQTSALLPVTLLAFQ